MKTKTKDINKNINDLSKKMWSELRRIRKEYKNKIKKLTSNMIKDDLDDIYCPKFDLRKNIITKKELGPCNKWSYKSDWFFIEVEDYSVYQTYSDSGYGDYDQSAMFRTITRYKVCPNCGRMLYIDTKRFEHGKEKTRWENVEGFDIRPIGWKPKIRVIKGKKNK